MLSGSAVRPDHDSRRQQILAAQVAILSANATVGVGVTILAATILTRLQWRVIPRPVVLGWWLYMILVSVARYVFTHGYRRAVPPVTEVDRWRTVFAVGPGLSGTGWGAAGIFLYPEAHLSNQVFLIFVLGGMMLGAASLLAPRPEAFLAFLIPTGLGPTIRLFAQGGETHLAMGILAGVFTLATLITTSRIYRTVDSSLRLKFENRDLVEDLRAAKEQTEALNQALELRVQERTAELHQSTEQLRAEVTQREHIEEELLRARKLESLGVLAGGIAHDFNNFLTVVQGNVEMAKACLAGGEPAQAFLDSAASACQRAAFLSSQLLTFAKGGAPVRRVVPLAPLVMDVVRLARSGAAISVEVHIDPDLRSAEIDADQISQVLHNILLNARQATPEGGIIEVRVENVSPVSGPGTTPLVRISIRDFGSGISPEVLPRIFDPYFTTKPGGSGLGLATAYAIIAKHGGHISVESKPGGGTLFAIDLPASEQTALPQVPITAPMQTGTGRLLVMDDEEALRSLLQEILRRLGYQVQTARDGAEAIALYDQAMAGGSGFDAVLLDLTVSGGMGGIEAAAKLKELDPAAKLIVSSGYSDASVMSNFAEYGFDAVIPKPWTATEISEVFRKVLVPDPDRKIE